MSQSGLLLWDSVCVPQGDRSCSPKGVKDAQKNRQLRQGFPGERGAMGWKKQ